ncbi:MAG: hypothetical protein ACTSWG_10605, partial [Candidatus Helarchaeota archaeon]
MEKQKITVYTTSEFFGSVVKYEGYLVEHGRREYAQYKNAPYVVFVPRRKRKAVRIQKGYKPYLLILKGWENIEPDGMYGKTETKNGVTIKTSKYNCFDESFKVDFDVEIDKYEDKFIAD